MASVLVFVEHHNGTVVPSSLGVMCKGKELASQMGAEMVAVVAGADVGGLAASLGAWGAGKVLAADDARFGNPVAGPLVDVMEAAVKHSDAAVVLASASVLAAEWAGALAARLGVGITTDGIDISCDGGELRMNRPALDDSVH